MNITYEELLSMTMFYTIYFLNINIQSNDKYFTFTYIMFKLL